MGWQLFIWIKSGHDPAFLLKQNDKQLRHVSVIMAGIEKQEKKKIEEQ